MTTLHKFCARVFLFSSLIFEICYLVFNHMVPVVQWQNAALWQRSRESDSRRAPQLRRIVGAEINALTENYELDRQSLKPRHYVCFNGILPLCACGY